MDSTGFSMDGARAAFVFLKRLNPDGALGHPDAVYWTDTLPKVFAGDHFAFALGAVGR